MVDTVAKLQEISHRLDHLESAGEWIARTQIHEDSVASQTGSLIMTIAEDLRDRILEIVTELERELNAAESITHH